MTVPTISLNSGYDIPQLGAGTWQVQPDDTERVVTEILEVGYRHIDTAEMYENEAGVGAAIAKSGIPRDELFITTKLSNAAHDPAAARDAFAKSLEALGLDYLDLFLIHWPLPTVGDYVQTWNTVAEFTKQEALRSAGVSNFQVPHLEKLAAQSDLVPAVNQIELHPYFGNREVAQYGREHGIVTEAWSPIAQGKVVSDPVLADIAAEVGRTPAQVALRWHIQQGNVIFPKSTSRERLTENFQLFDFELSGEQVARIDALDRGAEGRGGPHPDTFDFIPG